MGTEEPYKMKRVPDYLKLQVAAYALQYPDWTVSSAFQVDSENIRIFFRTNESTLTSKLFPYIAEHCFRESIEEKEKNKESFTDEKSLERAKMFVKM